MTYKRSLSLCSQIWKLSFLGRLSRSGILSWALKLVYKNNNDNDDVIWCPFLLRLCAIKQKAVGITILRMLFWTTGVPEKAVGKESGNKTFVSRTDTNKPPIAVILRLTSSCMQWAGNKHWNNCATVMAIRRIKKSFAQSSTEKLHSANQTNKQGDAEKLRNNKQ